MAESSVPTKPLLETTATGDPLERLAALAELGQEFTHSLDIDQTLRDAVAQIVDYMEAEAASVFLMTAGGGELECRACAGPVDVTGLRLPYGQGIVGRTAAEDACQLVSDAADDPDFEAQVDDDSGFQTRSMVCSPLRNRDGVIGVLQVLNKRDGGHFDERDRDVLRILAAPAALAINNARMASDLLEQHRLKKELSLARRLQRSLLPARTDNGFPLVGVNLPARQVSGDFFDYFRLADGRIAFTIGDVAGKGINASLLMVRTTTLLRWIGKSGISPGDWIKQVNNELMETVSDGMFVCAVAGYFDPSTGQAVWANAGFPPPLHYDGERVELFAAQAPPLAVIELESVAEQRCELAPGSSLYLYSDGVSESRDGSGQMLGEAGLRGLIADHQYLPHRVRLGAMVSQLERQNLNDDTTLLVIEGQSPVELLDIDFNACPTNLKDVRQQVSQTLASHGADPTLIQRLVLVIDEACANVIRHGYNGDREGAMKLRVIEPHAGELRFELRDYAPTVDPDAIQPRALDELRPGGLGINFIDSVMDHWRFKQPPSGPGNILEMSKVIWGRRADDG